MATLQDRIKKLQALAEKQAKRDALKKQIMDARKSLQQLRKGK